MTELKNAVIVGYGRSAMCRARKGSLAGTHPVEWGSQVLSILVDSVPGLTKEDIEDIIVGCAAPFNETGMNIGRLMSIYGGFPYSTSAQTINRFCASGLQAISSGANSIAVGETETVIAGGIESMSCTFGKIPPESFYRTLDERDPGAYMPMGLTAENVAEHYSISRKEMDEFAVNSHKKAFVAQKKGYLNMSILPVIVLDQEGKQIAVKRDEGIRPDTSLDSLSKLEPCFKADGLVTAATSSQTTDGVSFVVMMEESKAIKKNIKPLARFKGFSIAGCDPKEMGLGPIFAVPKVLDKTGLKIEDLSVIELNEAFASQSIACIRKLGLPEDKVNPWGGAIALGHPMGATGAFLTCKALDHMKIYGGKYALVTMCIGGGMGAAAIYENLNL